MNHKEFVTALAKDAGDIIRSHFVIGIEAEFKEFDGTPLTIADTEVNALVIKRIKEHYPDHRVMGEEENYNEESSTEYVWVCDPLDGTIPYSHGLPTVAFSLALVRDGRPVTGVLYDPFMERMIVSDENGAVTLNGKQVRVSDRKELSGATMSVVLWKNHHGQPNIRPLLCELVERNVTVLNALSVAYAYMLLAAGAFDAVVFPHFQPHDSAAAKLIVENAGGKVTNFKGRDQRYDQKIQGVVASNGRIHDELLTLLKENVKEWT